MFWRNLVFVFLAFFVGEGVAAAAGSTLVAVKAFVNSGAGANHSSANSADATAYGAPIDTGLSSTGSLQCKWASLTGTIDATVTLQSSNDGTTWEDKAGAVLTVAGASADGILSLTNITETAYQAVYAHNGVTGGTLNCKFVAKP